MLGLTRVLNVLTHGRITLVFESTLSCFFLFGDYCIQTLHVTDLAGEPSCLMLFGGTASEG